MTAQTEQVLMVTDGSAYAEMMQVIETQKQTIDNLNKSIDLQIMACLNKSIAHENKMKAINISLGESELKAYSAMSLLSVFCDEVEGKFENDERVEVIGTIEMTTHYLASAKFLAENSNRKHILESNSTYERIAKAVDQFLPWSKSPVSTITNEVKK